MGENASQHTAGKEIFNIIEHKRQWQSKTYEIKSSTRTPGPAMMEDITQACKRTHCVVQSPEVWQNKCDSSVRPCMESKLAIILNYSSKLKVFIYSIFNQKLN